MNITKDISEPSHETVFRQVDRRYITLSRVTGLIFSLFVAAGLAFATVAYWMTQEWNWISWAVTIGAGLLTMFLLITSIVWPALSYKRLHWRLGDFGLEIHRGVLWRHQISIPVARVQHADVSQGPLQRQFGLGTLIVHTAGTQNSSVELDGLAHDFAVQLRDQIVKQKEAVDVV